MPGHNLASAQFARHIVAPALRHMGLYSPAAVRLLLGTALHESGGLLLVDQWTGPGDETLGPAIGLYQVEPATHDDVWRNVLFADPDGGPVDPPPAPSARRAQLVSRLRGLTLSALPRHERLLCPFYATAIARLVYWRRPEPLPDVADLEGLAAYYKAHFNSHLGASTPEKWLADFRRFGGDHFEPDEA